MSLDHFNADQAYRQERLDRGWGTDGREAEFANGRDPYDEWHDYPPAGLDRVTRPREDDELEAA